MTSPTQNPPKIKRAHGTPQDGQYPAKRGYVLVKRVKVPDSINATEIQMHPNGQVSNTSRYVLDIPKMVDHAWDCLEDLCTK